MTSGRIVRTTSAAVTLPSLPLLGKIKVGVFVDGHPASIDYFRCASKYAPIFDQVYGEKPTKLELAFHTNDIKEVCREEWIVRDKAGRLLSSGDGETWRSWSMKSEAYVENDIATVEEIEKRYGQPAKATLTLRFVLLRIPNVLGLWQFESRGDKTSIPAIRGVVDHMLSTYGRVTNISFDLVVAKVKSNSPGSKSAYPVVSLVPNMSADNLQLLSEYVESGHQVKGIVTAERLRLLTAAVVDTTQTPKLLAAPADARSDK